MVTGGMEYPGPAGGNQFTVTVNATGAVAVSAPLVPVTVTVYVPAEVPAETTFEQATVVADPLQPPSVPTPAASAQTSTSPRSPRRRRTGSNTTNNPASAAPDDPPSQPVRAAATRQLLVGPTDTTAIVAVPVPPAARFTLPGVTEHVGGWLLAGVTVQPSTTAPVNPLTDAAVSVHTLVDVVFATGVTDSVDGFAASVKLPVDPAPPPAAASSSFATSNDPSPVTWSYPVPTTNPASPPVRLVAPGSLLLHIEGVALEHPTTPDVATVTS